MSKHVVLGGGWSSKMRCLQSVKRSRISADAAANSWGFRLLQEDTENTSRAIRGGSWSSSSIYACCAYRHTGLQSGYIGFRLVQEVRDD